MFSWKRRRNVIGAAVVAVFLVAGGTALGTQLQSAQGYTGCLSPSGDLTKIASGDTPLKPCTGNQVEAHLAGSDIGSILAGTGLTSDTQSGAVTLSIDPRYSLPQGCEIGQIARWNGTTWFCSDDVQPLP